jgi:hypothetical protein
MVALDDLDGENGYPQIDPSAWSKKAGWESPPTTTFMEGEMHEDDKTDPAYMFMSSKPRKMGERAEQQRRKIHAGEESCPLSVHFLRFLLGDSARPRYRPLRDSLQDPPLTVTRISSQTLAGVGVELDFKLTLNRRQRLMLSVAAVVC